MTATIKLSRKRDLVCEITEDNRYRLHHNTGSQLFDSFDELVEALADTDQIEARSAYETWNSSTRVKNEVTLEVCSNVEWLRENAGLNLDRLADGMENDAAREFGSEICSRLENFGYKTCSAKGQRITFHGWNGANTFAHKLGPVGTFDDLTTEQESEIFAAIAEAQDAVESRFAAEVSG